MYKIIVLLFTLALPASSIYGQTNTSMMQRDSLLNILLEEDVITEDGKSYLIKKLLDSEKPITKSSLLHGLAYAFNNEMYYRIGMTAVSNSGYRLRSDKLKSKEEKDLILQETLNTVPGRIIEGKVNYSDSLNRLNYGFTSNGIMGPKDINLIGHTFSALGGTRTMLVNKLREIEFVGDQIADSLLDEIKANKHSSEYDVVAAAAKQVELDAEYPELVKKMTLLITELVRTDFMSAEAARSFSINTDPQKAAYSLLQSGKRSIIQDVPELPKKLATTYKQFYVQIDSLLGAVTFDNIQAYTETTASQYNPNSLKHKLTIDFFGAGRKYTSILANDWTTDKPLEEEGIYMSPSIFSSINQYLNDIESPYRIQYIRHPRGQMIHPREAFVLTLMTKEQYELWHDSELLSWVQEWMGYSRRYSSSNRLAIFYQMENLGFFVHLSPSELDSARTALLDARIENDKELLLSMDAVLLPMDYEFGAIQDPYNRKTQELSRFSKNVFTPSKIIDDFEDNRSSKTTNFGFTFSGKQYRRGLNVNHDYYDVAFIDLINQAVQSQHRAKFYSLDGYITFLTDAQFTFIKTSFPSLFELYD